MDQTQRTEEIMVICYRCGRLICPGEGRYNVLPQEAYCSWTCLHLSLPHIAEAIRWFATEPRQAEKDVRS